MGLKPGYKRTEVGVIPADWDVVSLFEITQPHRPISYGIVQTGPSVMNGVRCLRVLDINDGSINKNNLITTSRQISDAYKRTVLMEGDLVMPLRGKVGDVGLVDEELEGANLTRGVALIAVCEEWSAEFCKQLILWPTTRSRLERTMNGSALQEIPIATLRSFQIPRPAKVEEQHAIATTLGDVDGLLDGLDRLIAKKHDLKQAAMQQLLTGQTRLPGFQASWEVKQLGEVVDCAPSGTYGVERQTPTLFPMPVATTAQISGDDRWNGKAMQTRFFTAEQVATSGVSAGDLVVVKSSGSAASIQSGKVVLIDRLLAGTFLFSNFLMRLRPKAVFPRFLYSFLTSNRVKSMLPSLCEASTYPNIRINEYLQIEVPVPSLSEQMAIATMLSDMDSDLAALEARRDKTRALKQGMMQELLTGRMRLV